MKKYNIVFSSLILVSIVFAQQQKIEIPFSAGQISKMEFTDFESSYSKKPQLLDDDYEKKSVGLALIYSLLLPGMGEAYVGETGYTKFFLATEAIGWGLLISNSLQAQWLKKDYQNYAVQHAGIDRNGKDDKFWIDIGKYDTIYDYNEDKRRDRNVDEIYTENLQNFWQWDARDNRIYYDWQRIRARNIERQEVFFIGGIVLNHIVSAINALRLARAHNKKEKTFSWHFGVNVDKYDNRVDFLVSKSF